MKVLSQVLQVAANALTGLQIAGIVRPSSPLEKIVIRNLEGFQAAAHDYSTGQAVIVADFTEDGKKGYLIAVQEGGPTAEALGLS